MFTTYIFILSALFVWGTHRKRGIGHDTEAGQSHTPTRPAPAYPMFRIGYSFSLCLTRSEWCDCRTALSRLLQFNLSIQSFIVFDSLLQGKQ